ncbi:MAG: hypothetical protein VX803_06210 [Pseudomonadota bacterium]|nr:hypothetical protein [Pseudomonadota bacterium]
MINNIFNGRVGAVCFSDTDIPGIKNTFKDIGVAYATSAGVKRNVSLQEHWQNGVLNEENLCVVDGFNIKSDGSAEPINARVITQEHDLLLHLRTL